VRAARAAGGTVASPATLAPTEEDARGNLATGDTGTAHVRGPDGTAALPAEDTSTPADAGAHPSTRETLRKRGKQTLIVTDTLNRALTATASTSTA
jgi:hypothetical protein